MIPEVRATSGWRQFQSFVFGVISVLKSAECALMPERRSLFTITRVGLILWAATMVLLIFIPARYWHYPDDIWLRILVMTPAMISLGLFFFDTGRQAVRDWKHFRSQPPLWQNVEEDADDEPRN